MLFMAAIFLLLGVVAVLPVIAVVFSNYDGPFFLRLEMFISSYDGLLVSVGTLLLVTSLAVFTTYIAGKFVTERDISNRKIQVELKLAEFRQEWINSLRDDFARYSALTWSADNRASADAKQELVELPARIIMRLNPKDDDYEAVREALLYPVANPEFGRKPLAEIAQTLLKREWERLKSDLQKIDGLLK